MDKEKIIEIAKNPEIKTNKDLMESRDILVDEFQKTKDLIINLTRHLEIIEEHYNAINNEIGKRLNK